MRGLLKRHQQWKESRKSSGIESENSDNDTGNEDLGSDVQDWDFSTMKAPQTASPLRTSPTIEPPQPIDIPSRKSSTSISRKWSADASHAADLEKPSSATVQDAEYHPLSILSPSNNSTPASPSTSFTLGDTGLVKVRLLHDSRPLRTLNDIPEQVEQQSQQQSGLSKGGGWGGDGGWQPWNNPVSSNNSPDSQPRKTNSSNNSTPEASKNLPSVPSTPSPLGIRRLTREMSPLSGNLRLSLGSKSPHSRTHSRTHSRSFSPSSIPILPSVASPSLFASRGVGNGGVGLEERASSPTDSVVTSHSLSVEFDKIIPRNTSMDEAGSLQQDQVSVVSDPMILLTSEIQKTLMLLNNLSVSLSSSPLMGKGERG